MTSDYYAILGVAPASEGVAISAAYRALIRHYHPDANPDPEAQAKAREITAAYAVLRDPQKRAEYDARRCADEDLWSEEDRGEPVDPPRAPAMRGLGIALAILALGLIAAVWVWPQANRSPPRTGVQSAARTAPIGAEPVVELQPESERLARLREEAQIPEIAPRPEEQTADDPLVDSPKVARTPKADPVHPSVPAPGPAK